MAVKIRLKRIGSKKKPFYRIVVADSRFHVMAVQSKLLVLIIHYLIRLK